jgi:peptidoglycan hydrolase-like protein with peptidoglycan-binding domain/S1-C subfamily serine protease
MAVLQRVWCLAVVALFATGCLAVAPARAQEAVWLQIEARPNLASAEERARDYASRLENVVGFRLASGWYAIALGPYTPEAATAQLSGLRSTRQVPGDSFVSDGAGFRDQFWPTGATGIATPPIAAPTTVEETALTPPIPADETVAEARASERLLNREEREELQRALQIQGFYNSRIDGSIGPGTRNAMAAWQEFAGYEVTGVLTSGQRAELVNSLRELLDSLAMRQVLDIRAGIEIDLPMGMVTFKGYDAPFARYAGEDVQVLLISQSGDRDTLQGLYDVMQTLEIVPLDGAREIGRTSFTLTGRNDRIFSYTYAEIRDDAVKGYTLVWPTEDALRGRIALDRMQASFTALADAVLPDTAGDMALQRPDLLAGLQIRQSDSSVSGFYVTSDGTVLTVAAPLAACARITLDGDTEADLIATDTELGLALLRPRSRLAPLGIGRITDQTPRLQSDIAVAGYSYGGRLGAPTMSFGTLEDLEGLEGEDSLKRLALNVQPGDAGGPVLDTGGAVVGLLLPKDGANDRTLPEDVNFAADAEAIIAFLEANGIAITPPNTNAAMAPEDLALLGADMTVLVECWN